MVVLTSTDYGKKLGRFQGEYYALMMFAGSGMMLLAATTELISIYISLELATLPLVALAAFLGHSRSGEAGLKFFLMSAVSSAVLLYGIALIFGFTGTTQLEQIASALSGSSDPAVVFGSYAVLLGVVLIVAGFGFKLSAVPFQMWVPDVYEGSPTPVAAFLSVASKAAAFAVVLRVFYVAFPESSLDWSLVFAGIAAASMTIGNIVAISQQQRQTPFGLQHHRPRRLSPRGGGGRRPIRLDCVSRLLRPQQPPLLPRCLHRDQPCRLRRGHRHLQQDR